MFQLFNINGMQRMLPTLGIFAEAKKCLAELVQTTLEILSADTGCLYTESQTKLVHLDFKSESFPFKATHTSYPSLIETFLQEYFDAFI